MKLLLAVLVTLIVTNTFCQSDTINQKDMNGRKQGHWIYYGKDRPEAGYPSEGKIEEGPYLNDRKEGVWIKYYNDGVTPKFTATYHNNRPCGPYKKIGGSNIVLEEGNFRSNHYVGVKATYYDDGQLKQWVKYNNSGLELDTSYYYFPNGCKEIEIHYEEPGVHYKSIRYLADSCNKVRETIIYDEESKQRARDHNKVYLSNRRYFRENGTIKDSSDCGHMKRE